MVLLLSSVHTAEKKYTISRILKITFYLEKVCFCIYAMNFSCCFFSSFIRLHLLLFSFHFIFFHYNYRSFQFPIYVDEYKYFNAWYTHCILYNEIIMWYFSYFFSFLSLALDGRWIHGCSMKCAEWRFILE